MSTQWKTGSGSFNGLSVESAQFILDIGKFCNWISFFLADGQHLSFWHTCFWLFEFKISDIWQQLSYRTKLRTTDLMALPLFFHLFLWWIFFFIFFTSSWIFWKDSSLIVCSIRHASLMNGLKPTNSHRESNVTPQKGYIEDYGISSPFTSCVFLFLLVILTHCYVIVNSFYYPPLQA